MDNIENYIYPIFTNLLGKLQGLEGGTVQEGFNHRADYMLQELKERILGEIREVDAQI